MVAPPRARNVFVGRDDVTSQLTRVLDDARRHGPRVVLIEGEAGIGKSRLLAWFRDLCRARGFANAHAAAREFEQQTPLGPLIEALAVRPDSRDDGRRTIARLLLAGRERHEPTDSDTPSSLLPAADARAQLLMAMSRLIEDEAAVAPLALVLDDLQWADTDTVDVLRRVVQRGQAARLIVMCAFRPSPKPRALAMLAAGARAGTALEISLRPLDEDAVQVLVSAAAGGRPGSGLLRAVQGARGNPFFVRELVAALQDDERIEIEHGLANVVNPGLPPSLRTTVIRRMAVLPDETQHALRWASMLGSSFSVADFSTITGAALPAAVAKLQPALDAHFLIGDGLHLAFRHDLVHEAIYGDMPEAVRTAYHLHVGRTLAATGAAALTVAPHFARGAIGHEQEAASWLKRAADEVELRSPATAVGLLRRALEVAPPSDPSRSALRFSLARALLWSGDWISAEEEARTTLEHDEGAAFDGALRYVMARALVYRGRTADSVKEARQALEYELPVRDRARLLADMSMRLPLLGELSEGELAANEAIELASDRDGLAVSTARSGLGLIHALRGRPKRAIALAQTALPRGDGSVSESVEFVQPYFYYSLALVEGDEYERAAAVLSRLRVRTDEMGMTWARGLTEGLLSDLDFKRGRWSDALAAASMWERTAEETGTRVWLVIVKSAVARIAIHQGDLAAAQTTSESVASFLADAGSFHLGMTQWWLTRALLHEALGDDAAARAALDEGWRLGNDRGHVTARRDLGPDRARLAVRNGDRTLARAIAHAVSESAAEAQSSTYRAAGLRAVGWADGDPASLVEAAAIYRSAGRPLESARSSEDAGLVLAAGGDPASAAGELARAILMYEELGATRDAARVSSSLRSAGVVRGVRGPRSRPAKGWESLTPTEREVAGLAADGLTNREIGGRMFVSSRTVGTHLGHVFEKLELSSRVELAAAVARQNLD